MKLLLVILGVAIQFAAGFLLPRELDGITSIGPFMPMLIGFSIGTVVLGFGLGRIAHSKGHSHWFGLFAFLSWLGAIAIALLPNSAAAEREALAALDKMIIPDGSLPPFGDPGRDID